MGLVALPARLHIVTLGVSDLARARSFYQGLGWELCASSNPEIAWFRTTGGLLGLFPHDLLAADAGLPDGPRPPFRGVTLAMCVETPEAVQPALEQAAAAGATIVKPATRAEWGGVSGYFTDPDGHAWEVAWNQAFPIAEDGSLTIP